MATMSITELRAERADLQRTEQRLSYERRLVQGRIDILRAELLARAEHREEAGDIAARLSAVLTDRAAAGSGPLGVTSLSVDVPDGSEGLFDDQPADLSALDLDALDALATDLESRERDLSEQRREIFAAIDRLAAELADRYRADDVPVAELLEG